MFAPPPPPSSTRKRKRGGEERQLIGGPFVVQSYISASFDVTTKVSPAVILLRSHIPISWLAGAASRLFDSPTELPPLCAPGNIVVVKLEGERQLSAVEWVRDNVYAIYRLSTQLRMKDIRKVASQTKHLPNMETPAFDVCEGEWWKGVGSSNYPFGDTSYALSHATLDMGLCKLEITEEPKTIPATTIPSPLPTPGLPAIPENVTPMLEDSPPAMSEVLEQVRHQYYDTLYLAKTPLAYFAKSTLSRARAACQDCESIPPASRFDELNMFLRKLLLPLANMDLKYRKTMVQSALEKEVEDPTIFREGEEDYVHRWRLAAFEERFIKEETDPMVKQKLEEIRIRETELQIILLLEILALNKEHPLAAVEPVKGKGKKSKAKGKKGKKGVNKEPDQELVLELLVDRLCIWHSVGSDIVPREGGSETKGKDAISEKDHLRHFSVEVIMAFYASKLPEKCAYINNKFGGGRSISGPKPAATPRHRDRRTAAKKSTPLSRSTSRIESVEPINLLAVDGANAPKTGRGGNLGGRNFSKHVVEFSDKKIAQKKVEQELQSVIQALKKPNRVAAASQLVDDAERRMTKAPTRGRAAKPAKTNVLVNATPRKRKLDLFAPLESEASRGIPDTSRKPRRLSSNAIFTPPSRRMSRPTLTSQSPSDGGVIKATPRKSLFGDILRPDERNDLPAPPKSVPITDAMIFATPQKKDVLWLPHAGEEVAADTPMKPVSSALGALRRVSPPKNTPHNKGLLEVDGDIYGALGWD